MHVLLAFPLEEESEKKEGVVVWPHNMLGFKRKKKLWK